MLVTARSPSLRPDVAVDSPPPGGSATRCVTAALSSMRASFWTGLDVSTSRRQLVVHDADGLGRGLAELSFVRPSAPGPHAAEESMIPYRERREVIRTSQ